MKIKEILNIIWECWANLAGVVFAFSFISILIFGGSFNFNLKVNWHSAVDLWNTIKNYFL